MEDDFGPAPGLEEADVVTKYKMAGEIANAAMAKVVEMCQAGASVRAICAAGDEFIFAETQKVFAKKVDGVAIARGVGFPTCLSVNEVICHFSPLSSEPDVTLNDGDLVKIDLGAHIDGYIAVNAHSVVIGASADAPVTGRKADVVLAAHNAIEAIARLVRPGKKSGEITQAVSQIAADFNCTPIQDMLCFQMSKDTITDEKSIIQNPSENSTEYKEIEFEENEVYGLDVLISTGEGKGRASEMRTTVFRRTEDVYSLKLKQSRAFYSEVSKRFTSMPFSLRSFEDETKARMGLKECVEHGLVEPYHVLTERDGELVAQFRTTVLLMPNGNLKITSGGFDAAQFSSEFNITSDEMKQVLATSLGSKSKKKKKKKAKKTSSA
jgi:curved DNA binding protein